jgi:hypothetical protein
LGIRAASNVRRFSSFRETEQPTSAQPSVSKDERQAGSIVRGNFKAAPDIRLSGPAAGGGYVLRAGQKVKICGCREAPRSLAASEPVDFRMLQAPTY